MKQVLLVAKREYVVRMRSKAAIISMIVIALLFLGGGTAARIFIPNGFEPDVIGLTTQTQDYAMAFTAGATGDSGGDDSAAGGFTLKENQYKTEIYPSEQDLERAVQHDEVVAGVGGTLDEPVLISKGKFPVMLRMIIQATHASVKLNQYVTSLGGDMRDLSKEIASTQLKTKNLETEQADGTDDGYDFGAYLGGLGMLLILFLAIFMSGQMVATGVMEEKASRVIEVLVSAVSPARLLVGKIIGITAVGVTQLVVLGGSALGAMAISGLSGSFQIDLGTLSGWLIVWFILGLATYMVLYAGAGAMASKQEDLGQTTIILMLLQMAGFYAAMFMVGFPGKKDVLDVVSMLPFVNCYLMPARQIVSTTMQWWEPILSVLINLAILPVLIWLGAKIYRRGILATGSRIHLKDVFARQDRPRATRRKNG